MDSIFHSAIQKKKRNKIWDSDTIFDNDHKNPIHYLRIYFNFGYYLCYIPFRFVRLSNGSYSTRSNSIQQIICGVNHILALARFLTAIRETRLKYEDKNPSLYFEFARNFATFFYMLTFMVTFWKKKAVFLRIFGELQVYHYKYRFRAGLTLRGVDGGGKYKIFALGVGLCTTYTLISFLNVIFGAGMIEMATWEPKRLLSSYAGLGKFMFFLQENRTAVPWEQFSVPTYIFTGFQILIQFYFKLGAHYADLYILIAALTLWNVANHFSKFLAMGFTTFEVLEHYSMLKKLAKSINLATGPITLCAILEAMPYYATHIGDILYIPDWWGKFRYIFFIINFFSILVVAADTTQKVYSFKEWLSEGSNSSTIEQSKLVVILSELSTNCPAGLSAMGLLTVTYGFIGTLVSVVITYAVIILQFKTVNLCGSSQSNNLYS